MREGGRVKVTQTKSRAERGAQNAGQKRSPKKPRTRTIRWKETHQGLGGAAVPLQLQLPLQLGNPRLEQPLPDLIAMGPPTRRGRL